MGNVKISVCVTVFNEKSKDLKILLDGFKKQTLKPDEIIIVERVSPKNKVGNLKSGAIKLFKYENISRSRGRNLAVKIAKNEIIAMTDAGCILDKNWLKELAKCFDNKKNMVVAGGYKMFAMDNFNKSAAKFLGVDYLKIGKDFLPSARSLAFRKRIWQKINGFPETLDDTAEDTMFNYNLIKNGIKIKVNKKAFVTWIINENIFSFFKKIFRYSLGDLKTNIWWHPVKKIKTHNLKIVSVILRYAVFILLLVLDFYSVFWFLIIGYLLYSTIKAGKYGIVLQIISDLAILSATICYAWHILKKLQTGWAT